VLGLAVRVQGYRLIYHDASAIHQTEEYDNWELGPLCAFIYQLYRDPFVDPSMKVYGSKERRPTWVIKVGSSVYIALDVSMQKGLGQRRFTARAEDESGKRHFIKDFYFDLSRRFYEVDLLSRAHSNGRIPGLMNVLPAEHGHVLDVRGGKIKTTSLGNGPGGTPVVTRYKIRIVTPDVGELLTNVKTMRQLWTIVFDACVGE
jgi:hypothetical protein